MKESKQWNVSYVIYVCSQFTFFLFGVLQDTVQNFNPYDEGGNGDGTGYVVHELGFFFNKSLKSFNFHNSANLTTEQWQMNIMMGVMYNIIGTCITV